MFNFIKIFIIFLNIFFINNILINAKKCIEKDLDDADVCMQKMLMIGDRSQKFRETLQEMHQYCRNITDLQKCVKRYSRECLTRLARQVTNQLMAGVTKVNKPVCANNDSMSAFGTQVAKCGNINIESKHKCMDQYIQDLKFTESQVFEKKIPFVCCNFWKFKACIKDSVEAVDDKRCPKQSKEGISHLISGYSGEALDLICGEFDEGSDKCKKLMDSMTKVDTKKGKSGRKLRPNSRSILPSFIKIFTNI